jgi:uncharacterized protein with von Willebrand factor type A (vWA) domain
MPEGVLGMLVDFGRELRSSGLAVGSGDVLTYCAALADLDPTDLIDLYWAGRVVLTMRRDDIPVYDEAFRRFFLGSEVPADDFRLHLAAGSTAGAVEIPASTPGSEETSDAHLGLAASTVDILRHKAFAECTDAERAALRRIMARIRLTPPRRRTRRTRPADTGHSPDLRRTIRRSLRTQTEPITLCWRARRPRPRPLVLILDVSGSMAAYSRALLQFAYSAHRAARKVDVFCFGTRLTRITTQLRTRSPDDALARAAAQVVDWDGGTRIGASLTSFIRGWARQGLCRGAIVIICSDGLDRGDPELLATAMERLSRLCRWLVWLNPHDGTSPSVGMTIATPHIDHVLSAHDLHGLERLAALLPQLR